MPRKNIFLFAALIIFSFSLMTYQSSQGPLITTNAFHNLLDNSYELIKFVTDSVKLPFRRMALREEENIRLRKQVDELVMENKRYHELELENKRLKQLLELRQITPHYVAAAGVIARGTHRWAKTLTINKGEKDGVLKDMAVITPKGLAGKIAGVSESYAEVLLLTDINFSASVRFQGSRREGILSGTGMNTCVLKYIPNDIDVSPGEILVTSGLDSFYPRGIPVGYISKAVKRSQGAYFQYIEVTPFQDDTKIEEVIITQ